MKINQPPMFSDFFLKIRIFVSLVFRESILNDLLLRRLSVPRGSAPGYGRLQSVSWPTISS